MRNILSLAALPKMSLFIIPLLFLIANRPIRDKDMPIITLINYAIHPEVISNAQSVLSLDLGQPLYVRIESEMLKFIPKNLVLNKDSPDGNSISTPLNLFSIGTARRITSSGEGVPNIGYYLKRNVSKEHSFLFQLINDSLRCIFTKEDFIALQYKITLVACG